MLNLNSDSSLENNILMNYMLAGDNEKYEENLKSKKNQILKNNTILKEYNNNDYWYIENLNSSNLYCKSIDDLIFEEEDKNNINIIDSSTSIIAISETKIQIHDKYLKYTRIFYGKFNYKILDNDSIIITEIKTNLSKLVRNLNVIYDNFILEKENINNMIEVIKDNQRLLINTNTGENTILQKTFTEYIGDNLFLINNQDCNNYCVYNNQTKEIYKLCSKTCFVKYIDNLIIEITSKEGKKLFDCKTKALILPNAIKKVEIVNYKNYLLLTSKDNTYTVFDLKQNKVIISDTNYVDFLYDDIFITNSNKNDTSKKLDKIFFDDNSVAEEYSINTMWEYYESSSFSINIINSNSKEVILSEINLVIKISENYIIAKTNNDFCFIQLKPFKILINNIKDWGIDTQYNLYICNEKDFIEKIPLGENGSFDYDDEYDYDEIQTRLKI